MKSFMRVVIFSGMLMGLGDWSASPAWAGGLLELVSVPAGSFTMGNCLRGDDLTYKLPEELPQHTVTLAAYQIGKYEVTNGQVCTVLNWALGRGYLKNSSGGAYAGGDVYAAGQPLLKISDPYCQISYAGGAFSWKTRTGAKGVSYSMAQHPAVDVTWHGAAVCCNWLSEKEGLTPCYDLTTWKLKVPYPNGYRLPTEAEWERAAAWDGSKHWIYGFTSDALSGKNRCNYWDKNPDFVNPLGLTTMPFTAPSGWFNGVNISPNGDIKTVDSRSPAGCYDMSGNAWEWCNDWFGDYPSTAQTDPTGNVMASYPIRIARGGSWDCPMQDQRTASRGSQFPTNTDSGHGFRVARSGGGGGQGTTNRVGAAWGIFE